MFWKDTDKELPTNKIFVKVKVADFKKDYIDIAHYNESDFHWYSKDGYDLNDNVYRWKFTNKKSIISKVLSWQTN